jgi:large subunit ribosomal protein L18
MNNSRNKLRLHRERRVRSKINGTTECPRLSVFRSLQNIYAQVIDDSIGATLVQANLKSLKEKNSLEGAKKVGEAISRLCAEKKIERVVFDRGGYKYHGKVKALAEGAREGGLKF